MPTAGLSSPPTATTAPERLGAVFLTLFLAYQLPEGLGKNVLDSFPAQAALMLAFLPVAWLCGRALGFRGLDAWYLSRSRRWLLLLAACFALSVCTKYGALAIGSRIGVYRVTSGSMGAAGMLMAALPVLAATFFPSIAEDIVTRGFVMRALPSLRGRWLFMPTSAAIYVLNHIYRLANGPGEWLMLFSFGLAYGAALHYGHTLWAAVGLHWGWNFAGQFTDQVASVDALVANSWLISAAAHLILLAAVVLLLPKLRTRT